MRNLLIKDFRYNILNSAYIQINLHLHISRIDKKIKTKILDLECIPSLFPDINLYYKFHINQKRMLFERIPKILYRQNCISNIKQDILKLISSKKKFLDNKKIALCAFIILSIQTFNSKIFRLDKILCKIVIFMIHCKYFLDNFQANKFIVAKRKFSCKDKTYATNKKRLKDCIEKEVHCFPFVLIAINLE